MPIVSVVIPTHNRAHLLWRAIRSVQRQTFPDLEIIVVDDCSSDNTSEVMRTLDARQTKYIRHTERRGGSAARNTGIETAKGEYIAFLDDDDEWLPDKLCRQISVFQRERGLGMVYSGYSEINDHDKRTVRVYHPRGSGCIYKDVLRSNCIGTTSTAVLKTECLRTLGGFDVSLPASQDWDLWIRVAREYQVDHVADSLVRVFLHDVRISYDYDAKIEGRRKVLRKVFREIENSPEILSYHHFFIGRLYLYKGDVAEGRRELLKALKTYPFNISYYKYFLPSLFGASFYNALSANNR